MKMPQFFGGGKSEAANENVPLTIQGVTVHIRNKLVADARAHGKPEVVNGLLSIAELVEDGEYSPEAGLQKAEEITDSVGDSSHG